MNRYKLSSMYEILILLVGIIFFINSFAFFFCINPSKLLLISALIVNLILLYRYKNNSFAFFMFFTFFTVFLYLIPTYFIGIPLTDNSKYTSMDIFNKIIYLHLVFFYCYLIFAGKDVSNYTPIVKKIDYINSPKLFWGLYLVTAFSILFLFKGQVVLFQPNSYSIYIENLKKESGLPEYLMIFFIILKTLATKKRQNKFLIILTVVFFIKLNLLGYRVSGLMVLFYIYYTFIDGRVKSKMLFSGSIGAFFLLLFLGKIKDGIRMTDVRLENLLYDPNMGFVLSHQTAVFYTCSALLGLINDGLLNFGNRILSFIGLILNTFLPSGIVAHFIPQVKITSWGQQFVRYGGGGLPPTFFYIWLGYIGVILISFILGRITKALYRINDESKGKNILVIYVYAIAVTMPRWIFYDVGNFLFRIPLYTVTLYLIIKFLKLTNIKNNKRQESEMK